MDRLFMDLNSITSKTDISSVHLCDFPISNKKEIDASLEDRMLIAQRLSSLVLGLRKKEKIRVRQPLARILIPVLSDEFSQSVADIQELILSEVNVKSLTLIKDDGTMLVKNIRPNFKSIGKKFGAQMKGISSEVAAFNQDKIRQIENEKLWEKEIEGVLVRLELEDFEISAKDIPGLLVASDGELTVALDITITEELHAEGIAREFVNRVQALRKEKDFDVTDRIIVQYSSNDFIEDALEKNRAYICAEVLADVLLPLKSIPESTKIDIENEGDTEIYLQLISK